MKKVLNKVFVALMLAGSLGLAACAPSSSDVTTNSESSDVETNEVKSIKISSLAGEGSESNPYKLELNEGEVKDLEITVEKTGTLDNILSFELLSGNDTCKTDGSNDSLLKVTALKAGEASLKISSTDGNAEIFVSITVKEVEKVLVESMYIPLDEGEGTIDNPYLIKVSATQQEMFSFTVKPSNATNKSISWNAGSIVDGKFVEGEAPFTIEDGTGKVSITALENPGVGYIQGMSMDGSNVSAIIKVEVLEFKGVSQISSNAMKASDEEGIDYVIHTAMGVSWDMTEGELDRKNGLVNGTAGPGAGQALRAENLTYWPSMYNVGLEVSPSDASDKTLVFDYDTDGIVEFADDGSYEALSAGTCVVTIASVSNPDVSIKVKVVVEDSLFGGILMDAYNNKEVSQYTEWDFDLNPDNLGSHPLLFDWNYVQVQTNSVRGQKGDDGNQKIFFLGNADRVYGFCLESNVAKGDLNKTTALAWNKVHIDEKATAIDIKIGNNDKSHGQYRVVLVDSNKNIYTIKDWTSLTTPNSEVKEVDLLIPEGAKGKDCAIVIEQRLTKNNNNCELHVKGVWIKKYTPVTQIEFAENEVTLGQGGTYELAAEITPVNATNKAISYKVSPMNNGVSVDEYGVVTVGLDAVVGEYTITATSEDNPNATASYKLIVNENKPVTSFELEGITNNQVINATIGNGIYGDAPITLIGRVNIDASDQQYVVRVTEGESARVSNGKIEFVKEGLTKFEAYPLGNEALKINFTVNVNSYKDGDQAIKGLNKTEVNNMVESEGYWYTKNVDKSHGGSKIVSEPANNQGIYVLEGHATRANFNEAINIVYNKMNVGTNKSLEFKVHSHTDDRVIESTNIRARAIKMDGTVVELVGWTTIANRWKQNEEWFTISLNVEALANETVVFVIEQTGSLQNNGDFPKYSDSAAGAYLHMKEIALSKDAAKDFYSYRVMARTDEALSLNASGFKANVFYNGIGFGGAYTNGIYNPLALNYEGSANGSVELSTASQYSNRSEARNPQFYVWGVYPALNNSHQNNDVTYEMDENSNAKLEGNKLIALATGEATLRLKAKAFGSDDTYVSFDIKVLVSVK